MPIKVAIWSLHPGDLLGEAIDFVTHGPAQHAGFIRGNGMVHELYLPRIRDRVMTDAEKPFIRTFDIVGLTNDLNDRLERHFDVYLSMNAEQYSIADLFRIVLNTPKPDDSSEVCSQYVFQQLAMIGLPPCLRCDNDFISPRDILISLRLI